AMFGMSVGAVIVYILPSRFPADKTLWHLAQNAFCFALATVFSFLTHLSIPFSPRPNLTFLWSVGLTYFALSLPFIFSGICVCLVLTRVPTSVNRIYAVDLAGASLGCVAVLLLLNIVDGPSAVILVAAVAAIGSAAFACQTSSPVRKGSITAAATFLAL